MSPRRSAEAGGNGSRVGLTALLLVLAAVGMLLLVRAQPEPEPFDPRSAAASGARALVLLLERQGASVDVVGSAPGAGAGQRVLVLQDRLNDDQRSDLLDFAAAGGVVVVADPASPLAADLDAGTDIAGNVPSSVGNDVLGQINVPVAECDVAALQHLRGVFVNDGELFGTGTLAAGDGRCFSDGATAFVVVRPRGAGLIVQLGDNEIFTNGLLRYADNGPLATALLAPAAGARVSILIGEEAVQTEVNVGGGGEKGLLDLVRPGVWMALAQLAIAFIVFAMARAVRPGRPVREPEQVPVAGSELVVATGNLMQRARHAQRAGWLLRGNLYRSLCRQFHLPSNTSIDALDAAVSAHTSLPPGHVASVLQRDVADNDGLVHLSNSLHEIREAALVGGPGEGANSER